MGFSAPERDVLRYCLQDEEGCLHLEPFTDRFQVEYHSRFLKAAGLDSLKIVSKT